MIGEAGGELFIAVELVSAIAVDRVIRRALAKRPAERPASADEMTAGLRGVPGVQEIRRMFPLNRRTS